MKKDGQLYVSNTSGYLPTLVVLCVPRQPAALLKLYLRRRRRKLAHPAIQTLNRRTSLSALTLSCVIPTRRDL